MTSGDVTYHWLDAPVVIYNPPTFTEFHNDILLPHDHTLRRFINVEPTAYWKRGSESSDDQQMYFINYRVQYSLNDGAPILYRSMRTLKSQFVVNAAGVTEPWMGFHQGAELELGFNERCQRGGRNSVPTTLRLTWSIASSGAGDETLAGAASVDFRALYSLPILP
jgi:hypothetical protein